MKKNNKAAFPFAMFIGLMAILLPAFILMTSDRIKRQKKLIEYQLIEKGLSLIRTFEAGTRAGIFNMRWGAQRIQTLVEETALQPDVVSIMIATKQGLVLSHSSTELIGSTYDLMPAGLDRPDDEFGHDYRRVLSESGDELFQVYKRFKPLHPKKRHGHMGRHRMKKPNDIGFSDPDKDLGGTEKDWSRPYKFMGEGFEPGAAEHFIFVSLSTTPMSEARNRLLKSTVFQAGIYFLFVCAGVVAVIAFQSYRQARASLKRITVYSDTVIQNMPAGLITTDQTGRVTAMNESAEKIFGVIEKVPEEFNSFVEQNMENTDSISSEVPVNIAADKRLLLDLNTSIIRDDEGEPAGLVYLFKDLTRIRELTRQVETNRRLAAIGKLAGGVAHEIRNPLSSIKGFATYFGKRYEDNESDRKTAQVMVKEVDRINRSITQLLEFSKPMAIERKDIDINGLIEHSLKLVEQDLERKKIDTSVEINVHRSKVKTDGDRLNQVLLNLYMNALDALDKGGRLEIQVDESETDVMEIRVKDNGCGIEPDNLEQVFEPYYTTRATGTGLGLAIVHRIMENLGGSIRVESEPGRGTCFILSFFIGEDDDG